jgi:hypothetical protein
MVLLLQQLINMGSIILLLLLLLLLLLKKAVVVIVAKNPNALPFCTLWIWLGFWQDLFSHPNSTKKKFGKF